MTIVVPIVDLLELREQYFLKVFAKARSDRDWSPVLGVFPVPFLFIEEGGNVDFKLRGYKTRDCHRLHQLV